ncbi:MAG: hypothetical protein AAGJ46_19610 [Planctomycetota bacterium]
MLNLLKSPPVQITMNDGSVWTIDHSDHPTCSDVSLFFLKLYDDGKWRHVNLPLVTMSSVVSVAPTT